MTRPARRSRKFARAAPMGSFRPLLAYCLALK